MFRLAVTVFITIIVLNSRVMAEGHETYRINLPAQSVAESLTDLSVQIEKQLLFPYQLAASIDANPVIGRYTLQKALDIMLQGTGFSGGLTTKGVLMISLTKSEANQKKTEGIDDMNTKKNILASTIAFFMGSAVQGVVAQEDVGGQEENGWALEEIVVTATKREGTLQDTSLTLSVLSNELIEKRGLVNMDDYLATVAGASYIEISATNKNVILRGLSTGPFDPQTVSSVYLGEMPLSSAVDTFDINLVDMERIEIIKGPQGTLYGSSALGGIVRNIPISPNLESIEGKVKLDVSSLSKSDDTNQSQTGVLNIPLVENHLALRVVAYRHDNGGYIDIVSSPEQEAIAAATGARVIVKEDSGGTISTGARSSLLWQPTEKLRFNLTTGTQEDDANGRYDVSVASEGYEVSFLNVEPSEKVAIDYHNLVVEYDYGWATLLSSSSILKNKGNQIFNSFNTLPIALFGPVVTSEDYRTSLKSQEIRLASNLNGPWQTLGGIFYEDAQLDTRTKLSWIGDLLSNPFGAEELFNALTELDYTQKAIFGEVSYQFNEKWLLTIGGRHFEYDRVDATSYFGSGPFNDTDNTEDVSQSGNTYKANLTFTPNDSTLIYTQWSEGFRLGRGQTLPPLDLCDTDNNGELDFGTGAILTTRVEPDTTENIELGIKLSLMDKRLRVNTSIFRTDWDNLPVSIEDNSETCPGAGSITNNIGSASSRGIEIEANYLMDNWLIDLSASYIDTERTNVRPPLFEGEPLVYSPRSTASTGVQYNFQAGAYSGFIRTDINYVGKYESAPKWINLSPGGDYVEANFRLGINHGHLSVVLYGSNLTENDDLRVQSDANTGVRARPRSFGLEVAYEL